MDENKFPKQIRSILEYLDFIYDDRFSWYVGDKLINGEQNIPFRFELVRGGDTTTNIICYADGWENAITLFEVTSTISIGTFIVLLQEYNIIHNRYIYEAVDSIEDYFKESNEL